MCVDGRVYVWMDENVHVCMYVWMYVDVCEWVCLYVDG